MTSSPIVKIDMTQNAIETGREVILQEAIGLNTLAESLGDAFVQAVDRLAALSGRIVVTGMGKSGHVGRKIAATMASTGTPAYYVHPGEASHGDLGMITAEDAVIALSNSGETLELADIIAYTKRFSIPLIAMVGKAPSTLGDAADICLLLPDVAEASPVNAPTTSTTMSMALGDALAVALLQKRGFTKDDFATFHPGGKLGKQLLRAADLMHQGAELPLVEDATPMQDVLLTITAKHFGCAGVVGKSGKLVGIVTDGDLRRHMQADILQKTAADVMTASPVTIAPNTLAVEVLAIMNERSITSLFVLEADKPIGIVHIHDCLRAGIS